MPIYEYQCNQCAKTFEITQKISDPPLKICPTCSQPVTKLISRTSFQLKGSGWYATDYKKSSSTSSSTTSSADSTSSSEAKTETKSTGCGSGACGSGHKH